LGKIHQQHVDPTELRRMNFNRDVISRNLSMKRSLNLDNVIESKFRISK